MENKAKMLKLKEVELFEYEGILDVSKLLLKGRIEDTIFNALVYINNMCLKKDEEFPDIVPMIIHAGVYDAYNVEYNLFIEALSLNFTALTRQAFIMDFALKRGATQGRIIHAGVYDAYNVEYNLFIEALSLNFTALTRQAFIMDFALKRGATQGRGAMAPICLNIMLESIGLASVNNARHIGQSFYKPIVYENRDTKEAFQMAALTLREEALGFLFWRREDYKELVASLEYFLNREFDFEQKAYGASSCKEFWKKAKRAPVPLYKII